MAEASSSSMAGKLGLTALLGSIGLGGSGLFYAGFVHLSAPATPQDAALEERLAATGVLSSDDEVEEEIELTEDEREFALFNTPKYSYYLFPIPFISNLKESRKLLTIELAVSTLAPLTDADSFIASLYPFDPAMRDVILAHLQTKRPEELQSRADREQLKSELKDKLNTLISTGQQDPDAPLIDEVHIQKLVVG